VLLILLTDTAWVTAYHLLVYQNLQNPLLKTKSDCKKTTFLKLSEAQTGGQDDHTGAGPSLHWSAGASGFILLICQNQFRLRKLKTEIWYQKTVNSKMPMVNILKL
jgi:hypothetical protein